MSLTEGALVLSHGSSPQASSCRPVDIDRLSAVPSSGMVRDPINPNSISIDLNKEETRPKRASSIGATFRRLFSTSPANNERSSSETKSILGQETPSGFIPIEGAGTRGRTPPRFTNSPQDSVESSTLIPNNPYFIPAEPLRASDLSLGGKQLTPISDNPRAAMAAMASHRGADAWHQGGTRWITQRASSCPHHMPEMASSVIIEIHVP